MTAGTTKRLFLLTMALGGCLWLGACTPFAGAVSDAWPTWAGGMPKDVPPRPGAPGYEEFMAHQQHQDVAPNAAPNTAPAPGTTAVVAPTGAAPGTPGTTAVAVPVATAPGTTAADALGIETDDVAKYVFPKTWPIDREQRARIIGEWLQTEARFLA